MPVVLRYRGFRFFFYSNEGFPREPAHVHVRAIGDEAKFWLTPGVHLAYNAGFDARTLAELLRVAEAHSADFERAWNDHFS